MRILIVGVGAVGMVLAYLLERAGHEVTLLGRPGSAHASTGGQVRVVDEDGEHRLRAVYVDSLDRTPAPSAIVLTVKAFDTGPAAEHLRGMARDDLPLLLIQNGVGGEAAGLEVLPQAVWYGAVITLVAERLGPVSARRCPAKAGIAIAPLANVRDGFPWKGIFDAAGFDQVQVCHSYDAMKWSKLLLSILGNAIPAILDMPPWEVMADHRLFRLELLAYREALRAMAAARIRPIPLPGYPVPFYALALRWMPAMLLQPAVKRMVARGRGGKRPSLHIDLLNGRNQSEVAYINGAVARLARGFGTTAPVNEALTQTLSSLVAGEESWGGYRRRPETLLARCGQ